MEFSRQEYWGELPFPSPGDLPDPGIKPGSPTLQADSLPSEPPGKPKRVQDHNHKDAHRIQEGKGMDTVRTSTKSEKYVKEPIRTGEYKK